MQSQPIPSATTPKTLVIFSHPQFSQSRIHARLLKAIENVPGITVRHLDALYPDGKIDVKAEQLAVEQADNIVFQFPLYWYSFPALLKAYLDEVMTLGWAYNFAHTKAALWGKTFRIITSTGGNQTSYSGKGLMGKTIDETITHMRITGSYLGTDWRDPFVIHDTWKIKDEELDKASEQYKGVLEQ